MKILSFDTSCDETSVAITEGVRVLSNVISSQVRYHRKFGGVVPFLAQRLHKERIEAVTELAFQRAKLTWKDVDALAVTYGPGLAPALEIGLQKAKELARQHQLPLYGVNHMIGHLASVYAQTGSVKRSQVEYPALALLVSGKHCDLILVNSFADFVLFGQTLDDAVGEAYDKVARMLGLGYPGGRLVATLAEKGNPTLYNLPIPMQNSGDLNFSYSGLKNAARLLIETLKKGHHHTVLSAQQIQDVCAAFEYVAQFSLQKKVEKALGMHPEVKTLILAGGVASNTALRKRLRLIAKQNNVGFMVPANLKLCTDNAAMIGVAAHLLIKEGKQPDLPEQLDRQPSLGW